LIQKLIVAISLNNIGFIYEPVIARFIDVANNSFGLCVLKHLMTKVEKADAMRDRITNLLYENLEELIQNPYGNYAVQHALDTFPRNCERILDKILDKIIQYSNQKFSSNVIEKCLMFSPPEYKKRFLKEILKSDRIVELMKNKYGNFVILKVIQTAETEDKGAVMQSLLKNVNSVNVTKYKNRWIQFIEENPMKIPGFNNLQTVKPSLFKHNPQHSNPASDDNLSRDASDNDMGWGNDDWNDPRQDPRKKGKGSKEEKSQFFYTSNKPSGFGNEFEGEDRFGFNTMHHPENSNYAQSPGLRGPNQGFNKNANKGKGYGNQKQYPEKQGNNNKWGYNNFY